MVKELIKFCSVFGLPKIIQTDQGTNFTSSLFSQVLKEFAVKHQLSSAYHPESQKALERFPQTLKTMLRAFCVETGRDWDEGLPMLMFAIRETIQDSLGFCPADLVFGHTVRGPLKLLKEKILEETSPSVSVLEYVSQVREQLHRLGEIAKKNLTVAQSKMKRIYDIQSEYRSFQPGDSVLVLLPIPGSSLQARFSGPYVVDAKLSETDYVIRAPECKHKTRVCHINMLKPYVKRVVENTESVPLAVVAKMPSVSCEDDDLGARVETILCARLSNSELLLNIERHLDYLSEGHRKNIVSLIHEFPSLFADNLSQTNVLFHDIDVMIAAPIKQHPYRVNPLKREMMRKEVNYLLEQGLAATSLSPWSLPCFFCAEVRWYLSILH